MSKLRVNRKYLLCGAAAAALGLLGGDLSAATKAAPVKQVVTGPVASYWISTTTSSGLTMSGMTGGGKPSMSSIMGAMMGGGGGNVSHTMYLQLGSNQAPSGEAAADHMTPPGFDAGPDLPLYYKPPKEVVSQPQTYEREEPEDYQPPKGKILIFWGCGEHAPKGQPVVIDLAKIADPAQRMTMMKQFTAGKQLTLDNVRPPSPSTWKTYGEWPNEKTKKGVTGATSLLGAHTIKGNYSPQINFTLDKSEDFMAPVNVTGNARDAEGAVVLTWDAIPASKGWFATAMGGGDDTVVMWTSAQIQTSLMGIAPDYLTGDDIARLLSQKVLMPGDATTCAVPAEVVAAGQGQFFGLTAYGGETNFSYPPRPEDPKVAWNIQWTTKVRYRSTTGGILGQPMPGGGHGGGLFGMGSANDDEQASGESSSSSSSDGKDEKKKKKKSMFGDLVKQAAGGLIPGM